MSSFMTSQIKILCLIYSPGIEVTELLLFAGEDKKGMCCLRGKQG